MWNIGNIKINGRVVLGPMAGVTFYSYRKFMAQFGVDVFVSEMVSDCGLKYQNQETISYLKTDTLEHPFGVQLFGNKAETMIEAIEIIKKQPQELWPDFIDINLGCPVKKVTSAGSGSALLKDLDYLKDYMSQIVKASPWPVSAKIRIGWDEKHINVYDTIKVLESSGVSMISVHARTTKQLYSGKPNYELLKGLQEKMSVPLVVSGDIFTLDDAINAINITGASAVMVARGGMGNPTLIKQIKQYYENGERIPDASLDEQKKYCLELAKMMCEDKGEERAMKIFRTIGPRFFNGFKNSKSIKLAISTKVTTYDELVDILAKYQG